MNIIISLIIITLIAGGLTVPRFGINLINVFLLAVVLFVVYSFFPYIAELFRTQGFVGILVITLCIAVFGFLVISLLKARKYILRR